MIQSFTRLAVADNTGAKEDHVYQSSWRFKASLRNSR